MSFLFLCFDLKYLHYERKIKSMTYAISRVEGSLGIFILEKKKKKKKKQKKNFSLLTGSYYKKFCIKSRQKKKKKKKKCKVTSSM